VQNHILNTTLSANKLHVSAIYSHNQAERKTVNEKNCNKM